MGKRSNFERVPRDFYPTPRAAVSPYLKKIVSIGRVKWIEGSSSVGKDNCCWYLFDKSENNGIMFFGR